MLITKPWRAIKFSSVTVRKTSASVLMVCVTYHFHFKSLSGKERHGGRLSRREREKERGVTAHESSLPVGRLAELTSLPFEWPWHAALKRSAPTSDLIITDLLRGVGGQPSC